MTFNETIRRQAKGDVKPHEHEGGDISGELIGSLLHTDNLLGPWRTWSPSYTNLTIGNGTVVSRYLKLGKEIEVYYTLTWGSTTSIDGSNPKISPPVDASDQYSFPHAEVGLTRYLDSGTDTFIGAVRLESASNFSFGALDATATYLRTTSISATVPMTWTTNDILYYTASYEAA